MVHGREKGEGWSLVIGNGFACQGPLSRFLTQATRSSSSLSVYAGIISVLHSAECERIEVDTDADGIFTTAL
ncbi:TdiD protein [Mycena chlorophos]|uniref:TdiD protein n=1 Tax=Mycena chlorophos TaxID=658473 RepID=A0A8H6SUD6_MYCCL|nr:TdiD protein [Mycena chlorophos]